MSNNAKTIALTAAALLLGSLSLGGCATSTAGSSLMDAHAEAPLRPNISGYLPVEDMPSKDEKPAMTADERLKLQKELIAARDLQAARRPSTHKTLKSEGPLGGGKQALPGRGESALALARTDLHMTARRNRTHWRPS